VQVGIVLRLIPIKDAQFVCDFGGVTVEGNVTLISPWAVKGLDVFMTNVYDVLAQTVGLAILTVAVKVALTAVRVVVPYMIGYPFLRIWMVRGPVVKVEAGAWKETKVRL
jgi:hypothetical protein